VVYNLAHSLPGADGCRHRLCRTNSLLRCGPTLEQKEGFIPEFDEHFSLKLEHEYIQIYTPTAQTSLSPNLKGRPLPQMARHRSPAKAASRLQIAEAFAERQPVLMTVVQIQVRDDRWSRLQLRSRQWRRRSADLLTLLLACPWPF
jgi:hypothetical protein